MKNKIGINEVDFDSYLDNALKSHGYLFPETDDQMTVFEQNIEYVPLPKRFESPDFVFTGKRSVYEQKRIVFDNSEGERNWAIAARGGKEIPDEILAKMKKDKEEAQKNKNGIK
jgi:hypothetical protein